MELKALSNVAGSIRMHIEVHATVVFTWRIALSKKVNKANSVYI